MSLVLSEEHVLLQDMAKSFFQENAPISLHRSLRDEPVEAGFSRDLWQSMIEMGWTGISVPEEFDGLDFGFRGVGIVMEQAGRTLAASPMLSTAVLGASALVLGANPAQKQELLPRLVAGELLLALAVDEGPHHDPARTALPAVKSGEDYVLNGKKEFVIDGHVADTLIVAARTSGQAGSLEGLSLFLVDSDATGVGIAPRHMVDNRNASLVEFNNVTVSAAALLGEADKGGEILEQILDRGRIALAAEMLGSMQQNFEDILAYIKERKQFGQALGSFQALQHRAARMFSDLELCRAAVYEALYAVEEGRDDVAALASMAKALVNQACHNISSEGIQMHGGMGMTDECDIGFYLKRARVAEQSLGSASYHEARYATLNGF